MQLSSMMAVSVQRIDGEQLTQRLQDMMPNHLQIKTALHIRDTFTLTRVQQMQLTFRFICIPEISLRHILAQMVMQHSISF